MRIRLPFFVFNIVAVIAVAFFFTAVASAEQSTTSPFTLLSTSEAPSTFRLTSDAGSGTVTSDVAVDPGQVPKAASVLQGSGMSRSNMAGPGQGRKPTGGVSGAPIYSYGPGSNPGGGGVKQGRKPTGQSGTSSLTGTGTSRVGGAGLLRKPTFRSGTGLSVGGSATVGQSSPASYKYEGRQYHGLKYLSTARECWRWNGHKYVSECHHHHRHHHE